MKTTALQYSKALYELTKDKSQSEIDNIIVNLVEILRKNRQLKLAGKIKERFSDIWNKEKGIVEAEITTRKEVSTEVLTQVRTYLRSKYQAKEVDIKNKIDSNIQGGIVIKVGDEILDGSVMRQLQDLKNNLNK